MKICSRLVVALGFLLVSVHAVPAQDLPTVRIQNGASQLLLHGKPFLVLGGELGNSSAGTAAQADSILPRLAQLHVNTVLMPVAWDQLEPVEGRFDFSILDHWIEVARQEHIHLVILWFGSWKNAFSNYAPEWVLSDTKRFPRSISAEGLPLEILSPLGQETTRYDSRAFAALMRHIHNEDAAQNTVLMVQVENEIGYLGIGGRDRSEESNGLFQGPVPAQLSRALEVRRSAHEAVAYFNPAGHTWKEMFGAAADEVFMAWHYGLFANQVAEAGKKEYGLPMYMNAQLPAPFEQPGEYPSGGPHPEYLRSTAQQRLPSISTRPTSIGPTSRTGSNATRQRAIPSSFPKRGSNWPPSTLCTPTAKHAGSATLHSLSIRCRPMTLRGSRAPGYRMNTTRSTA